MSGKSKEKQLKGKGVWKLAGGRRRTLSGKVVKAGRMLGIAGVGGCGKLRMGVEGCMRHRDNGTVRGVCRACLSGKWLLAASLSLALPRCSKLYRAPHWLTMLRRGRRGCVLGSRIGLLQGVVW